MPSLCASDVGTSSVRALLYDSGARQMEGYGAHLPYSVRTTPDGGAEIDPEELAQHTLDCLDELHRQVREAGFRVAAVGGSAFSAQLLRGRRRREADAPDPASSGRPQRRRSPASPPYARLHRMRSALQLLARQVAVAGAQSRRGVSGDPTLSQLSRISVREAVRRNHGVHLHGLGHGPVESERQQLRLRRSGRTAHPPGAARRSRLHGQAAA